MLRREERTRSKVSVVVEEGCYWALVGREGREEGGTYTSLDCNTTLAISRLEALHWRVGFNLYAHFVQSLSQRIDQCLQSILEGVNACLLQLLRELSSPSLILTLHPKKPPKCTAIPTLQLPCKTQQRLRAQIPHITCIYAMEHGRHNVVSDTLVDTPSDEGANGFIYKSSRAARPHGFFDETEGAAEDAGAIEGEERGKRGCFGGETVETVGEEYEAVFCARVCALGVYDFVDEA